MLCGHLILPLFKTVILTAYYMLLIVYYITTPTVADAWFRVSVACVTLCVCPHSKRKMT